MKNKNFLKKRAGKDKPLPTLKKRESLYIYLKIFIKPLSECSVFLTGFLQTLNGELFCRLPLIP